MWNRSDIIIASSLSTDRHIFTIVGDQTPGSWKCLWEEHPGGKARSGTRHYSFHQAERPRICPQCPVAWRCARVQMFRLSSAVLPYFDLMKETGSLTQTTSFSVCTAALCHSVSIKTSKIVKTKKKRTVSKEHKGSDITAHNFCYNC